MQNQDQKKTIKNLTIKEHFNDLKSCIIQTGIVFIISFCISYYFIEEILSFLLKPLFDSGHSKVISTGLAEIFIAYIKLSFYIALAISFPVLLYKIYGFIAPGLYPKEKKIALTIMIFSPILFYLGALFVFFIVMPKAWSFFLGFQIKNEDMSIILEAKVNEYVSIAISFMFAFGLAFQLPIIMIMLALFKFVTIDMLRKYRRFVVIIIFTIAAILTPPDVFSQIALAIPMLILYEITILIIQRLENARDN